MIDMPNVIECNGFLCPICDKWHDNESRARNCCYIVEELRWICSKCGKVHDVEFEAKECCY